MKAIILAAGLGTRISTNIQDQSKCLLSITRGSDKPALPLLVYTIQQLLAQGIKDISIVTGHLHKQVEGALGSYPVQCIFNPFYYLVNSIGSLWFASAKLTDNEDLLILNGDTFIEKNLIQDLVNLKINPNHPLLFIDSRSTEKADVKVTHQDSYLTNYGKKIAEPASAESTDIFIIPKKIVPQFLSNLNELLDKKMHDTWWESALVEYKQGLPILVKDIAGKFWAEIDYIEDYQRICNFYINNTNN